MSAAKQRLARLRRGAIHAANLSTALARPGRRRFLAQVRTLSRRLPAILDQPLPQAMAQLTPTEQARELDPETMRRIVDAATGFGAGRPLGICLRRSLLRYYFLRQAGLPLTIHFGARRLGEAIGGHAWLTLDGQPFHEQPEHYRNYLVMFSYPSPGSDPAQAAGRPRGVQ